MSEVAVLYSGGKDSTYTIEMLRGQGMHVACLITVISENKDSYMLHTANIDLVKLSAEALQLPIFCGQTRGMKEEEVLDIERAVALARDRFGFDRLACGGLASLYQKNRIQSIARNLGMETECPLWGLDQKEYLHTLIRSGYKFTLTSVSAAGLDESWLGRCVDEDAINELVRLSEKFGFNPALEGGEGESLVLDCPLFERKRLKILESKKIWNGYNGSLLVSHARLDDKRSLQI